MKKGFTQICLGQKSSVREALDLCKRTGYSGLEIILTNDGDLTLNSNDETYRRISELSVDSGVEIISICGGGSLCDNDPTVVENSKRQIRKMLEAGEALGVDTVLTTGGWPGASVPYDVAIARIEAALLELKPDAERHRVNIGLENVWNRLFISPVETRDMLDRINSPYVGCYFDTGNVVLFGYPEQWIKILGTRIKKIHLKDFKMDHSTRQYSWPQLMQGDVNWPAVMAEIRAIGYNGYLTTEVCGDEQTYAETSRVMDALFKIGA